MVALVRSGWLRVAFATGGTSPALAGTLRAEFERLFDAEFGAFTEYLAEQRRRLQEALPKGLERSARLRALVNGLRVRGEVTYPQGFREWRAAGGPPRRRKRRRPAPRTPDTDTGRRGSFFWGHCPQPPR